MVGDVMFAAFQQNIGVARRDRTILADLHLEPRGFQLLTVHRAENVDQIANLKAILDGVAASGRITVFPIHPRTRAALKASSVRPGANVRLIDPVGYLEMLILEEAAEAVVTDSGGVQKEAYFDARPCSTRRDRTEWIHTG